MARVLHPVHTMRPSSLLLHPSTVFFFRRRHLFAFPHRRVQRSHRGEHRRQRQKEGETDEDDEKKIRERACTLSSFPARHRMTAFWNAAEELLASRTTVFTLSAPCARRRAGVTRNEGRAWERREERSTSKQGGGKGHLNRMAAAPRRTCCAAATAATPAPPPPRLQSTT